MKKQLRMSSLQKFKQKFSKWIFFVKTDSDWSTGESFDARIRSDWSNARIFGVCRLQPGSSCEIYRKKIFFRFLSYIFWTKQRTDMILSFLERKNPGDFREYNLDGSIV